MYKTGNALLSFTSGWSDTSVIKRGSGYLGYWDWENCGSRPAWTNSSRDSHFQNNQSKWTGVVAQVVEWAPALQVQSPEFRLQPTKTNKQINKERGSGTGSVGRVPAYQDQYYKKKKKKGWGHGIRLLLIEQKRAATSFHWFWGL
jgi:hypothetical protein